MMEAQRVALITGANKGIGFEVARQLGANKVRVLVGSRDGERGRKAVTELSAEGIDANAITIDVTNQDSISAAAREVEQRIGKLDILVNNAGIGLDRTPPSELDISALRTVLDTNFFGALLTTKAFLPLLRKSPSGRIVNVSSALGSLFHLSDPHWIGHQVLSTPYSMSKVALNAFTALLSAELIQTRIKVNSVEPGYTATDMTRPRNLNALPEGARRITGQTPAEAARVVVKFALIGDDGPTGGYFDINGRMPW